MRIAWQGFQSDIPDDWAPAVISGNRKEGYLRIASPDVLSIQIRWRESKLPKPKESDLRAYLSKLERDSKRLKQPFKSSFQSDEEDFRYSWTGNGNGTGRYFHLDNRAFFIEASATTKRSTQGPLQKFLTAFQQTEGNSEPWILLGLAVQLPCGAEVSKTVFQSGRTRLEFIAPRTTIVAERWGFGAQIVAKHSLEEWSKETTGLLKSAVSQEERGLRLTQTGLKPSEALIEFDEPGNQIRILKVSSRVDRWKAQWDWLI